MIYLLSTSVFLITSPENALFLTFHTSLAATWGNDRFIRHNSGRVKSTKRGIPWKKIKIFNVTSRSEAMVLETKIKNSAIVSKALSYLPSMIASISILLF